MGGILYFFLLGKKLASIYDAFRRIVYKKGNAQLQVQEHAPAALRIGALAAQAITVLYYSGIRPYLLYKAHIYGILKVKRIPERLWLKKILVKS